MKVFLLSTTMKNIMCCHMCDVCLCVGGGGQRCKVQRGRINDFDHMTVKQLKCTNALHLSAGEGVFLVIVCQSRSLAGSPFKNVVDERVKCNVLTIHVIYSFTRS